MKGKSIRMVGEKGKGNIMRDLKKWCAIFLTLMLVVSGLPLSKSFAANQVMTVDLSADTGKFVMVALAVFMQWVAMAYLQIT